MIATFCLRLAFGLLATLPILPARIVPPRFFRVHFLTALGLLVVAGFFLRDQADSLFWLAAGVAAVLAFAGSFVWHLDDAPGGRFFNFLAPVAFLVCLVQTSMLGGPSNPSRIADDVASAAVIGSAVTAMLMGHSYLIAPSMSMTPLMRLFGLLGVSLLVRMALACAGLWWWTRRPDAGSLELETSLWLAARWALGLVGPILLGWMAWETARIRSTQSATGILYVVVIVCFLGELTSQLLWEKTGYLL